MRSPPIRTALVLIAGLALHVWLGLAAIRAQSPTFDEPVHLTAGYVYWRTGEYRFLGEEHPPLSAMIAAVPLLFLRPALPTDDSLWTSRAFGWGNVAREYAFANRFLYHNPAGFGADRMVDLGRSAILAASCVFLLAFWGAARSLMPPVAANAAFLIAALSPTLLAHGTLVTPDFLFMAFYFLFFHALHRWEKVAGHPGRSDRWAVATGVFLGLAFCSRYSALAVAPVLVCWVLLRRGSLPPWRAREYLWLVLGAVAPAVVLYQGTGLSVFGDGLASTVARARMGHPTFLLGRHAIEGWWYYFPVTLLVKTPLPVLVLLAWTLWALARERVRLPWLLWLPPAIFLGVACLSSVQIGHRLVLAVYPFGFVTIGCGVRRLWRSAGSRAALLALGGWILIVALVARPHPLAYFNEAAGGRDRGYALLTDSNVDWGQGLRTLAAYLDERGVRQIYLSYFGTADPNAYGFRHTSLASITLPVFPDEDVDLAREPRALLVVAATNYQGTYYPARHPFRWLHDRTPDAVLAGSLLVFDITGDADAWQRVAGLLRQSGREVAARRAEAAARRLEDAASAASGSS